MGIDYELLGQRIREARIKTGMTQATLSGIIGFSPAHYSHIESGKARINLPTLVVIAQVLDTTIDSLLYDSTPVLIDSYDKDFKDLLEDCTRDERGILLQNAIQMKAVLKQNR
ncbi:MAG: helix-turn-helix domain-containing protein [Synergistaceae bacterium]|jgi:transcriptional regulator with XRE-family HTH domain|nr:helix-turn-helix domain-containing protein [Synergistaceae bacterium]NCB67004.1 XRE family transcriptional regulator [Bacilli bacterium]